MGVSSVIGGMIFAGNKKINRQILVGSAFFFGLSILAVAIMSNLILSIVDFVIVSIFSIRFMTTENTMMQLGIAPELRGRVMDF